MKQKWLNTFPNITCAVRSSSLALPRTSCSGHDRDSRSRCSSVSLLSRAEPRRSSPKRTITPWLSSSRAAARSSSSLLHSRDKHFTLWPTSDSVSDWWWHEWPEPDNRPGVLSPLAWPLKPATGLLAIACVGPETLRTPPGVNPPNVSCKLKYLPHRYVGLTHTQFLLNCWIVESSCVCRRSLRNHLSHKSLTPTGHLQSFLPAGSLAVNSLLPVSSLN